MKVQKLYSGQFVVTIPKSFVELLNLEKEPLVEWSLNNKMELILRKVKDK